MLTNPDMVHLGMLPYHPQWAAFLANLRYVVIDELHSIAASSAATLPMSCVGCGACVHSMAPARSFFVLQPRSLILRSWPNGW